MKNLNSFYEDSPTKTKTRLKILETAIDLYAENGMDAVSMMDIAKGCDVTIRNLYRYYANKELLVVDAAYLVMGFNVVYKDLFSVSDATGIVMLEHLLHHFYELEKSGTNGIKVVRFIMYFDLYMSKMPAEHPAFQKYVTDYRENINEPGYLEMGKILNKGIEDGSICIKKEEVTFYALFILQSLLSVIMRALVKESENKNINASLVEKQIDVIIHYLKGE